MQQLKHDKPWPKQTKTVSEAALQYITTWGGFVSSDGETVNNMTLKKLNFKKLLASGRLFNWKISSPTALYCWQGVCEHICQQMVLMKF